MSSSGHLVRLTWKSSDIIFNGTIAISAPNYNTVKPKMKLDEDFNTVRCSLEFFGSCVQLFEGIRSSEETLDPGSSQVLCLVIYFFGALVKSFLWLYSFIYPYHIQWLEFVLSFFINAAWVIHGLCCSNSAFILLHLLPHSCFCATRDSRTVSFFLWKYHH